MDIKNKLRDGLLLHESELLEEGRIADKIAAIDKKMAAFVQKLITYLLENPYKIINGAGENLEFTSEVIKGMRQSGRDFRAGLLSKKSPNYSEEARLASVAAVKDLGRLLSFMGMNAVLNTLVPFLGVAAGAIVLFFKDIAPDKIANFLSSSIKRAKAKGKEKVTEMLGILEDMGYYGVGDATQDEYTMGLKLD